MKIVGIEIKKIGIGKFFPGEGRVELSILFNDGADREIFRTIDASEAEKVAEDILIGLRKLEKSIHKSAESEIAVDNFVNIVIKEEDNLVKEIAKFVQKAKGKMDKIKGKNTAEGYLDLIRELKNLKLEF
ncbi:hypothetical protein KY347_05685 [Candidatus Woesearchaeota archaeon]|nr:hypothetical protein [Candidatus Woesearchaeota archaeon]